MVQILYRRNIELLGKKYIAYLKEVPTKLGPGGIVEATVVRAFIKEDKKGKVVNEDGCPAVIPKV